MIDPQAEGRRAFETNKARRSNPYAHGSEARAEWDSAYCEAMRELKGVLTREAVGLPPRGPLQFTRGR
jgi:hypothetical protein